mgnify:CR=1 FL=1
MNDELKVVTNDEELSVEEELEVLKSKLISVGVNSTVNSYAAEEKELAESFVSMSLRSIAPCWSYLNSNVKIKVLDSHEEEFRAWIDSLEE